MSDGSPPRNGLGVSRVVDAHLHIWPEPRPERPYPWTPDPHLIEDLLPVLDECGVDAAIQVTPTIMGFDNDYGLAVAGRLPERLGVFGRFDTDASDTAGRLARWMAQPGALGVRLTFFGATAASPEGLRRLEPFWAACEDQAVPVAVLAPDALEELAAVAARHPRLRLIVDHLGLAVYEGSPDPLVGWSHLAALAEQPNLRVKISTLVETSKEGFPFRDVHHRLAVAVELFGAERLIWASNHPVVLSACSYRESLEFLGACEFLDHDQLEWLTHRSLSEFLAEAPTGAGTR